MPKKVLYSLVLLLCSGWVACKKVDIQFGDQFLDNGYTQIVKIDSFGVDLSTIYVDSFPSSATGEMMIGGYTDPVFGRIDAGSYFEVVPPTYVANTDSLAGTSYDSVALILKPNGAYTGDTMAALQLRVDRLAQAIVPFENNSTLFYNTNSFAVMGTPLANRSVVIRPQLKETLSIRLDDTFGRNLFKKFQDPNDADIKTSEAFLQYLYGMRITAGAGSSLVFNCKDSAIVRVFYKKAGLYTVDKTLDFTLANMAHQFNHVEVDRSNAGLKGLPAAKQLPSAAINNAAYTLYAAGAMVKMRFPSVRDVLKMPSYAKVLKATLTVRPLRGTYGLGSFTLPSQLRLATTTTLNQVGTDLTRIPAGSASPETMYGDLVTDELYGESTMYTYDITAYIRSVIADGTINANGLLLLPPAGPLSARLGRVIIGDKNNALGKTELSILYASVQ